MREFLILLTMCFCLLSTTEVMAGEQNPIHFSESTVREALSNKKVSQYGDSTCNNNEVIFNYGMFDLKTICGSSFVTSTDLSKDNDNNAQNVNINLSARATCKVYDVLYPKPTTCDKSDFVRLSDNGKSVNVSIMFSNDTLFTERLKGIKAICNNNARNAIEQAFVLSFNIKCTIQ
jgi:hypothetical protein